MWPPGAGEMARRVREHAWQDTPLGPTESWPASMKSIVDMLLSSGFAMVALWGRGLISIYNDAYATLIGPKHPDVLGRPTPEAWPEFWPVVAPVIERVWAGETITFVDAEQKLVRRGKPEDGWFTNCYSPLRDETGAVAGVLVTLLETTARVRSEAALRAERGALPHAAAERPRLRHLPARRGRIHHRMERGRDAGLRPQRRGRRRTPRVDPDSADDTGIGMPEAELREARTNGRVETEGWRVHKDGTRFWANEIATAIRDERGDVVGFTKVSRDLSERKELQEQREELLAEATAARAEAEKANRAKDDFLITLSHELRTPLAPILLWARALRAEMVPANEITNAIEAIVMSAESQLQLIDDLRDLSGSSPDGFTWICRVTPWRTSRGRRSG